MDSTMMEVKAEIAKQASEFYQSYISPYSFIMAQIDKKEFEITQMFYDNLPSSVLNLDEKSQFLFAY